MNSMRLLLVPFLVISLPVLSKEKCQTDIDISARYSDDVGIHFVITNKSKRPIKISDDQFPWKNNYAVDIAAVVEGKRRTLEYTFPIDDPAFQEIVLMPGVNHDGYLKLAEIFKNFESINGDKIVFWHQRIIDDEALCVGENGGWLNVE